MRRRTKGLTAACVSLGLLTAACGGGDAKDGAIGLTGTVTVSGSSTVQPISSLVAELFAEANPAAQISVDGPGTGDGFVLFCSGETDVQDASRPIEPEEEQACADSGIEYVELPVAFDGITVMTNPANAVDCLTTGDLYALFGPESEGFERWSDANDLAVQAGGRGNFPDIPLEITAPGQESGTYDAFIELASIGGTGEDRGLTEENAASLRVDYQPSPNDNVILQAMEGAPGALGFAGYAYAEEGGELVKEIAVDSGNGCIAPQRETIADGSYPLSRTLFIYVNTARLANNDALGAFVDLYVSQEVLSLAVKEAGYVELPPDQVAATQSAWAQV